MEAASRPKPLTERPPLVLRPSLPVARRESETTRASALMALLAFGTAGLAFASRNGAWLFAVSFFGGGALLLAHIALYLRNASIFVTDSTFGRTTWLGSVHEVDRSRLARVVLRRVKYRGGSGGQPEMYFLDSDGRTILCVKGGGWQPERLSLVWARLGVMPEGSLVQGASLDDLNRVVRVSWARRNAGWISVCVMFALVLGLTIILDHFGIHIRR